MKNVCHNCQETENRKCGRKLVNKHEREEYLSLNFVGMNDPTKLINKITNTLNRVSKSH